MGKTFNKKEYMKRLNKAVENDVNEFGLQSALNMCIVSIEVLAGLLEDSYEENERYFELLVKHGIF